jgi:hypothetical protein
MSGASGTVDSTKAEIEQSTADQVEISEAMSQGQAEISAAQAKSSIDSAVSRNVAETAKNIK